MHSKGELYIYKGPPVTQRISNIVHRLNNLDLVKVERSNSTFIYVYTNKIGAIPLFCVYPYNLVPYQDFPEDDSVDKRSIAFWNKIHEHKLVFDKAFKS